MKKTLLIALMLLALALNLGAGLREPEPLGLPDEELGTEETDPDEDDGSQAMEPEVLGPYVPPITTGPDNSALYEKAAAYTGHESLSARLGDPDRYESAFSSKDGTLTVEADAKVIVPEADKAPLIRVRNGTITQEQADTLMETLVHCTLYLVGGPATKEELAQTIAELEQELDGADGLDEPIGPDTDMTRREYAESCLEKLRTAYEKAPDTSDPQPISGQFEPEFFGDDLVIRGEGESEEYGTEFIEIDVSDYLGGSHAYYERDGFNIHPFSQALARAADPDNVEDIQCTAKEAQALCDPIVEALDVEGMSFRSALKKYDDSLDSPTRCFWALQYTRSLGGLPITYTIATGDVLTDQEVYMVPWEYETMTFYVDDSGIVGLRWESPYELGEHVTEDAALLPFDEAMAIFEKMFTVAYDNDDLPFDISFPVSEARWDGKDIHVQVNEVRLGYTRIAEMDKEETGLLVPAWDFFGVITDEDGNVLSDDPESSLLTVNAVDGDIIDRDFGY